MRFSPCVWCGCGGKGGEGFRGTPPTPQVMELGRLGVPGGGVMKGLGGRGGERPSNTLSCVGGPQPLITRNAGGGRRCAAPPNPPPPIRFCPCWGLSVPRGGWGAPQSGSLPRHCLEGGACGGYKISPYSPSKRTLGGRGGVPAPPFPQVRNFGVPPRV